MSKGTVKRIGLLCLVMGGLVGYVLYDSWTTSPLFSKAVLGFSTLLFGCVFYMCGALTKQRHTPIGKRLQVDELMKAIDTKVDAKVTDALGILTKKYDTVLPVNIPNAVSHEVPRLVYHTQESAKDVQNHVRKDVRSDVQNGHETDVRTDVRNGHEKMSETDMTQPTLDVATSDYPLMTFNEVRTLLNVSERHLRRLISDKKIKVKNGDRNNIIRTSVDAYKSK